MFFNRVWEKKRESEEAYVEHVATLSDTLPHKKRPLPEVPPSPHQRHRSKSERHYESPIPITRDIHSCSSSLVARPDPPPFEVSLVDDDGVSPYAVVKRTSLPAALGDNRPQFTSTPNASLTEEVNPYASSTPLRAEVRVLFCFVLFCFVLFCFVVFCFVLSCFVVFCRVLLCCVLFCFVLFCFVLFCCAVAVLCSVIDNRDLKHISKQNGNVATTAVNTMKFIVIY